MPILLDALLSRIPSDKQQRAEWARDRFNPLIREALRRETGLRLKRPGTQEDSDTKKDEAVGIRLPAERSGRREPKPFVSPEQFDQLIARIPEPYATMVYVATLSQFVN